jgi:hypothetical protein
LREAIGESQVTVEQIRAAYGAQPFRPFIGHLANGRPVPVASGEFMLTAPSGRTIVVYPPEDSFNIIDLLLVTDLEFKPATDGTGRRRRP